MSAGPVATQIILVPIGASVDYGHAQKPPRYPQKFRTGTWRPATGIPDRSAHREASAVRGCWAGIVEAFLN